MFYHLKTALGRGYRFRLEGFKRFRCCNLVLEFFIGEFGDILRVEGGIWKTTVHFHLFYEVELGWHYVPVVKVAVIISSSLCTEVHVEAVVLFFEEEGLLAEQIFAWGLYVDFHCQLLHIYQVECFSS